MVLVPLEHLQSMSLLPTRLYTPLHIITTRLINMALFEHLKQPVHNLH